jgi:imidazolonepropionase-like amidohydrolase
VSFSSEPPTGNLPVSASRIRHARLVDGLHPSPMDDVAIEIADGLVTSVAGKAARANLKAGVDVLKVMASWGGIEALQAHRRRQLPGPPPPAPAAYTAAEMRAAVEEAHANGIRVTVHAESSESMRNAIAAGVDSIEHGTHLTDDVIALLVETGTTLVPTISTVYRRVADADAGGGPGWHPDVIAWARAAAAPWMDGLRRAVAAGVTIATGTDAGGDMATEISLLVEAGLSPAGALRSATSAAAQALGRDDVGAVVAGRRADMVIAQGAPDIDLADLAKISCIVRDGMPYQRCDLLSEGRAAARAGAARESAEHR